MTAAELEALPSRDGRTDLVRGWLVAEPPAGHEHGSVANTIAALIWNFLRRERLGVSYTCDTGFVLARDPDTVRAPDVAFLSHQSIAARAARPGFVDGPPDLAVEVVSPGDSPNEVEAKVCDYLLAGCRLVWVIFPDTRRVRTYRSPFSPRELTADALLDGEDVLPGFQVPVSSLFEI